MAASEGKLRVVIEDAMPDEKARGAAAAEAVFKRAGADPRVYFDVLFKMDTGEDLTEAEDRALALGDEAEQAAADACCAGWIERPDLWLSLDRPREPDGPGLVRRRGTTGLEIVVSNGDEMVKLFVQFAVLDVLAGKFGEYIAKAESHRGRLLEIATAKLHLGRLGRDLRVHVNVADLTDPALRPVAGDVPRLVSPAWEDEFSRGLTFLNPVPDVSH